ncbi:hypothetical protein NQ318_015784 [Aromia moschata]|uniref:Uncharacterized protein n=1 Tax=Aromia moschata TaxID=1265417 RepID=A0AAV8X831_9CUCU|nr:hypothetical protein NQ318_015784 [Aromia moschata]
MQLTSSRIENGAASFLQQGPQLYQHLREKRLKLEDANLVGERRVEKRIVVFGKTVSTPKVPVPTLGFSPVDRAFYVFLKHTELVLTVPYVRFWKDEAERWKAECDLLRSKPDSSDKLTNYYENQLSTILEANVMLRSEIKTLWAENMALEESPGLRHRGERQDEEQRGQQLRGAHHHQQELQRASWTR